MSIGPLNDLHGAAITYLRVCDYLISNGSTTAFASPLTCHILDPAYSPIRLARLDTCRHLEKSIGIVA